MYFGGVWNAIVDIYGHQEPDGLPGVTIKLRTMDRLGQFRDKRLYFSEEKPLCPQMEALAKIAWSDLAEYRDKSLSYFCGHVLKEMSKFPKIFTFITEKCPEPTRELSKKEKRKNKQLLRLLTYKRSCSPEEIKDWARERKARWLEKTNLNPDSRKKYLEKEILRKRAKRAKEAKVRNAKKTSVSEKRKMDDEDISLDLED
jgi:hypothetical protein